MAVKSVSLPAVLVLLVLLLFSAVATASTSMEPSTAESSETTLPSAGSTLSGTATSSPSDSVSASASTAGTSSPSTSAGSGVTETTSSSTSDSSVTGNPPSSIASSVAVTSAVTSTAATTASDVTSTSTSDVTNATEAMTSSGSTVTSSPSTVITSTISAAPTTTPKVSTEGDPCNNTIPCDNSASLQCKDDLCVCGSLSFWNSTHCVSGNSARPRLVSVQPGGRGTLHVKWAAPVVGSSSYLSGYRLHWNTSAGQDDSVEVAVTAHTITNLTSSSDYTLEVVTLITYRGQNLTSDPERISGRLLSYEGENCSSSSDCMNVTSLVCVNATSSASLCRCDLAFFWMSGACHSIEELTPMDVSADFETTRSFLVQWSPFVTTQYNVSYLVTWYDVTGQQTDQPLNVSVVTSNSYTISGLTPGAAYNVTVNAWIDEGFRSQNTSKGLPVMASLYPAIPGGWLGNENDLSNTTVDLEMRGVLEGFADQYNVTLEAQVKLVNSSDSSDGRFRVNFGGLTPGQNYTVSVAALSYGKRGESKQDSLRTRPAPASKVTNVRVSDVGKREMTVSWFQPDDPNGYLFAYVLQVFDDRSNCLKNYVLKCTNCPSAGQVDSPHCSAIPDVTQIDLIQTVSQKVTGLEPYRNYWLKIFAYNDAGRGIEFQEVQMTNIDVPPQFKRSSMSGQETSLDTSLSISLCVNCLLNETNGPLTQTGIVFHLGSCSEGKLGVARSEDQYREMQIYANGKQGVSVMRVTNDNFMEELKKFNQGYPGQNKVETVDQLSQGETFCVAVFACTSAGCTESEGVQFRTNPSRTPGIVGGVVGGLVAAALVLVVVVLVVMKLRRKGPFKQKIGKGRHSLIVTKPPDSPIQVKRPVKLADFPQHVALMHRDSNRLFSMEFEDLVEVSVRHPRECGLKEENATKNRYTNILPFDHSRVKLVPLNEDDSSDYINANYLPGYNMVREYIATQGPLEENLADFWRMVWDQKSKIIVSLSALVEGGRPKVDRYWPEKVHDPQPYGAIEVVMVNEFLEEKLVIRTFKISLDEETRTVKQYFLPGWEDYSANLSPNDVIEFIKAVRQERKPDDPNPMIIHCSAGVGRTGTFIALDVVQQFIRDKDLEAKLDIFALVLRMRDCREYMVQTEKQYIFVHDATVEMLSRKMNPEEDDQDHDYINVERGEDNQAFVREDDISVSMDIERSQV